MLTQARRLVRDLVQFTRLPDLSINLMHRETAGNDPFFSRIVEKFYRDARRRHPKMPLVRQYEYGVAVCVLPPRYEDYLKRIEPAGRRNVKKAQRLGYLFQRIDYNRHMEEIREIWNSTDVRQGRPFTAGEVTPCTDPPSRSSLHDYPYFGVLKENRVYAYGACLIAGEVSMLDTVFGHAAHQPDGIVPMLITGIARDLYEKHPKVRYFMYGTYFGAGETLRRFKMKFGFVPHHVHWELG
jgi:hypothetical protein